MQIFQTIDSSEVEAIVIVEPRGRIDSNTAREFADHLTTLIASGTSRLVVDFSASEYISSAGFRALLIAGKAAEEVQGRLVLCGMAGEIRRLFDLGAFSDLFMICSSREDSLARLR